MASTVPSLRAFFVFSWTVLLATASPPPAPTASPSTSPAPTCTDELVLFSPCLSYVACPPNDLADAASANCCNALSAAAKSGTSVCFCYLLQEPPILGFPLNSTRLLSLSSDCPLANGEPDSASSLNSLCSESPALPPLKNSATLGLTVPSTSGSGSGASSSQAIIPAKGGGVGSRGGGGGGRGGSSGNRGRNGSRPNRGGSSGVIGARPHGGDSSSETQICRSTGWLLLSLLSLLMTNMCCWE